MAKCLTLILDEENDQNEDSDFDDDLWITCSNLLFFSIYIFTYVTLEWLRYELMENVTLRVNYDNEHAVLSLVSYYSFFFWLSKYSLRSN